jgi:hypothetical protein
MNKSARVVKQTKRFQIVEYPTPDGWRERKVMHKGNRVIWDRPLPQKP